MTNIDLSLDFYFETDYKAMLANVVFNSDLKYETLTELAKLHKVDITSYHPFSYSELQLKLLNYLIEGHGIEYDEESQISYINMGDMYNTTILFNEDSEEYTIGTMGDYIESLPTITTGLAGCYMPDNLYRLAKDADIVEAFKDECINLFTDEIDDIGDFILGQDEIREEIDTMVELAKKHNRSSLNYSLNGQCVELHLNSTTLD